MNQAPAFAGNTLASGALISLNDALLKDRDRLLRSNLELEHFATLAAHDLKSPLHAAFSWLNILSEQLPENNFGTVSASIEIIQKNLKNAISYVNELLQISKVKEQPAKRDVCVVTDVVSDILMVHADSLKDANASVHQTDLPKTLANRKHLECVFSNLIGNSIKYKHPTRDLTITIGAIERNDCIEYFVQDNGLGIPATKLEDIFTLFESYPHHSVTKSTGIGLAFCRKIISLYGGRIWAESSEGRGSTIKFQLPKPELNYK
jgi:signal transduction histidine kinase